MVDKTQRINVMKMTAFGLEELGMSKTNVEKETDEALKYDWMPGYNVWGGTFLCMLMVRKNAPSNVICQNACKSISVSAWSKRLGRDV